MGPVARQTVASSVLQARQIHVASRKFLPGGDWPLERLAAASGVMEPFMLGSGVMVPK